MAALTQLVEQVLDLIGKVLVLSLYYIKLFHGFIPSGFKSEKLTVIVSAFLLACIYFSSDIIGLSLPFANNLCRSSKVKI